MSQDVNVAIVGGGAAGSSAALFLARAGIGVQIFDQERTILKRALLKNMPGSQPIEGLDYLAAIREQLTAFDIPIRTDKVTDVVPGDQFSVHVGDAVETFDFVILATGQGTLKLPSLPVERAEEARQPYVKVNLITDNWGATSVDGVYACGLVAGWPSQAVVCAGSGANVAVEIVSRVNDKFWVDHDDSIANAE